MIRNKNRSHGLNWIESWFIFPEEFLVRVGRLPRIEEQWETLQDNTHHQCWWYNQYSLKLLFLKTWWVTWSGCLSSANQSADVFFLFGWGKEKSWREDFICFWSGSEQMDAGWKWITERPGVFEEDFTIHCFCFFIGHDSSTGSLVFWGPVVRIFRILLWKGLLLRNAPIRIPNQQSTTLVVMILYDFLLVFFPVELLLMAEIRLTTKDDDYPHYL